MRGYTQLTLNERYQIHALLKAGHCPSEIAFLLGRHKSTISRELARNTGHWGYRPQQAQQRALQRQRGKVRPRFAGPHWSIVTALLHADWSPEQIAGRLRYEHDIRVSHTWIYRFIQANHRTGGLLHRQLRGRRRFRKRRGSADRRGRLCHTVSIDQRPAIVAQRRRLGDWEADTISGPRHQGHLVTLVERKSGLLRLAVAGRRNAETVCSALTQCLAPLQDTVHTITCDHGREFAYHERFAKALRARVYFAHPYAAWERGSNENTNGLIRHYFPKHQSLLGLNKKQLRFVEDRLNHRPRKRLGWKTPHEVFFKTQSQLVALTS